jgi:hypothetical protein
MPFRNRTLIILALLFSAVVASAQIRIASPYSRYGLGDLSKNNNAWNFAMGETGYALRSPYHVNFLNPASYTAFDSVSFVFEGGFISDFVTLSSNVQKETRNYASLGYISFGMPATRWWRTSISLLPYSNVGYSIAEVQTYTGVGNVIRLYTGEGGINRLTWGNGFKIFRDLSIGVNISYLFGNMTRRASVLFPDSVFYANFKAETYITMNDLYLDYGIQYTRKLNDKLTLTAGAVFAATSNLSAKTDYLAETFFLSSSGVEYPKDTIAIGSGFKGKITIPWMTGGGVAIGKPDSWTVTVDSKWQNWKKFTIFGLSDSLNNAWQINAGLEVIPNINSYSNYIKRIRYRLGFLYENTYLELRHKQLNAYAISVGLGLPLRGMKTLVNLGAQVGARGTTQQELIKESYFKFVVGFSIYDKWFVKRKYN